MAKADFMKFVADHTPPLTAKCPYTHSQYAEFNAVANAAEALTALRNHRPPLTEADVTAGMVEYNK